MINKKSSFVNDSNPGSEIRVQGVLNPDDDDSEVNEEEEQEESQDEENEIREQLIKLNIT